MPDLPTESDNAAEQHSTTTKITFAEPLLPQQPTPQQLNLSRLPAAHAGSSLAQDLHPFAHVSVLARRMDPAAESQSAGAFILVPHQSDDQLLGLDAEMTCFLLLHDTIMILLIEPIVRAHRSPMLAGPAHESTLTVEVPSHPLVPIAPDPPSTSIGIS
jgi:hypothetical protein